MLRLKSYSSPQVLSTFKYRDRMAIIGDILKSVKESKNGRKKTQIMQSANLNYGQTRKYLSYLINRGFITATDRQTYILTNKGTEFLYLVEIQGIHGLR